MSTATTNPSIETEPIVRRTVEWFDCEEQRVSVDPTLVRTGKPSITGPLIYGTLTPAQARALGRLLRTAAEMAESLPGPESKP